MPEPAHKGRAPAQPAPYSLGLPPIKGFLETSFVDWRGRISAVVFLPGCNFACPFCHNYTLVSDPQSLLTIPLDNVLGRLRQFVGWIDGVTVTGGEPTLHNRLPELLEVFKDAGFAVKLDTNGSRPEMVKQVVDSGLVDLVAMDIKAPLDPVSYGRACGKAVDVDAVRQSIDYLRTCGIDHEFRSTIVPSWHGRSELHSMAGTISGCRRWTLQAMNPKTGWNLDAMQGLEAYNEEELASLQVQIAQPACRKQA